jgi:hypothetical protein
MSDFTLFKAQFFNNKNSSFKNIIFAGFQKQQNLTTNSEDRSGTRSFEPNFNLNYFDNVFIDLLSTLLYTPN